MLTTPADLAAVISQTIKDKIQYLANGAEMTLCLKRALHDHFSGRGASSRWTGPNGKEFLFDFCAFADRQMDTAVESEWKSALVETHYDFEKLLYANAPLKVMVCDSPKYVRGKLRDAAEFLSSTYAHYSTSETYMIVNWRGNRAIINCHVWTPPSASVRPEEIRFQCVPGFPLRIKDNIDPHDDGWLGEID